MLTTLKQWARRLRQDGLTLWFAARHPSTPRLARWLAVAAVAYALSPIDLIPDFIPVLGLVDDLLILPLMVWLVLRLLPPAVRDDARDQADRWIAEGGARPRSRIGAAVIILIWMLGIGALAVFAFERSGAGG